MDRHPLNQSRVRATARPGWLKAIVVSGLLAGVLVAPARAAPFIWDQDQDRIDDRIATVHLLGYQYSFEQADTLLHQRIQVLQLPTDLVFGVYVVYDHTPTTTDVAALTLLGMPVLHRYEAVPALRSLATFPQAQAAAARPGVVRIEAVQLLYPLVRTGAAAIGARDPTGQVFPTWAGTGGSDGSGVVIAFLDTGINDAPDGAYPGHESLRGRCLGGASFVAGDSTLDTPPDGSVNPVDRGGSATQAHGTHVAGIALGSGGPSGYAMGVAPGARFIDVKALSDLGSGTGVPEAIDWCIHNRDRDWGDPDPALRGIDIINLSLSSPDQSDGQDLASRLATRATELGIVVVASVGNDGDVNHVPSPAAGRGVITVGAMDDQRTPGPEDDQIAIFTNHGPRADDGDADLTDEQKPDLVAPGVAVLSANGDLTSDGTKYQRLNGTSMAAAFVSGAVALIRATDPGLTPEQILTLFRATASRDLGGLPPSPPGFDPAWSPAMGFGVLDLYAARLELEQPSRSQVERLELAATPTEITATIRTQRETGAQWFVIERAPDLSGVPGTFAPCDSVAATGDPSLSDGTNRQIYARTWTVPSSERGATFWYRVAYSENGVRYDTPSRRFTSPAGPSAATLEVTIVHNAYDTDVEGDITVGNGAGGPLDPSDPAGALTFHLPGSCAAVSSDWTDGTSVTGNIAWTFRIEVPYGVATQWLPPSESWPWRLAVTEGGYADRSGQLRDFRLIWHAAGGDMTYVGGPTPQPTLEGGTINATIPVGTASVAASGLRPPLRFSPNPVPAGSTVTFVRASAAGEILSVFDLAGRRVAQARFAPAGDHAEAHWLTRDRDGRALDAGIYFARVATGPAVRVAVVRR